MLRYKKITIENARNHAKNIEEIAQEECLYIDVYINNRAYTISEKNGKLVVRTQGSIGVFSSATNSISVADMDNLK